MVFIHSEICAPIIAPDNLSNRSLHRFVVFVGCMFATIVVAISIASMLSFSLRIGALSLISLIPEVIYMILVTPGKATKRKIMMKMPVYGYKLSAFVLILYVMLAVHAVCSIVSAFVLTPKEGSTELEPYTPMQAAFTALAPILGTVFCVTACCMISLKKSIALYMDSNKGGKYKNISGASLEAEDSEGALVISGTLRGANTNTVKIGGKIYTAQDVENIAHELEEMKKREREIKERDNGAGDVGVAGELE